MPESITPFRLLMDYAAAHNTPIVATGDQSFMELLFTITTGFVFINWLAIKYANCRNKSHRIKGGGWLFSAS